MTRIIFKKIYDEVKEDMFDMSNVSIFNESKKKKKHFFSGVGGGCRSILCYVFGQLNSVKRLLFHMLFKNLEPYYLAVMLLGCRSAGIPRKLNSELKKVLHPRLNAA